MTAALRESHGRKSNFLFPALSNLPIKCFAELLKDCQYHSLVWTASRNAQLRQESFRKITRPSGDRARLVSALGDLPERFVVAESMHLCGGIHASFSHQANPKLTILISIIQKPIPKSASWLPMCRLSSTKSLTISSTNVEHHPEQYHHHQQFALFFTDCHCFPLKLCNGTTLTTPQ
jgi:hypothetical protein